METLRPAGERPARPAVTPPAACSLIADWSRRSPAGASSLRWSSRCLPRQRSTGNWLENARAADARAVQRLPRRSHSWPGSRSSSARLLAARRPRPPTPPGPHDPAHASHARGPASTLGRRPDGADRCSGLPRPARRGAAMILAAPAVRRFLTFLTHPAVELDRVRDRFLGLARPGALRAGPGRRHLAPRRASSASSGRRSSSGAPSSCPGRPDHPGRAGR